MEMLISVLLIATMTTTSLLQFIGICSPFWLCNIDKAISEDECEIKALSEVESDIVGLCVTCFSVSLLLNGGLVAWTLYGVLIKKDSLEDVIETKLAVFVSVIYFFCQFLGGIANVICFARYDVIGWAAILFFTLPFPVFLVVVFVVSISTVCFCCTKKDD